MQYNDQQKIHWAHVLLSKKMWEENNALTAIF